MNNNSPCTCKNNKNTIVYTFGPLVWNQKGCNTLNQSQSLLCDQDLGAKIRKKMVNWNKNYSTETIVSTDEGLLCL